MKFCTICWQPCKNYSYYCMKCNRLLNKNRSIASNLSRKTKHKYCPICFTHIDRKEKYCKTCTKILKSRKRLLSPLVERMKKNDYLELEYTYIIKDPKFFRKNYKDYVTYKIIELWLKTWYIFTQNLEILYKEWLPKRNRFEWKDKYFNTYLVPIIRKQYERRRLNAIWFWVDVAVEAILNEKKN